MLFFHDFTHFCVVLGRTMFYGFYTVMDFSTIFMWSVHKCKIINCIRFLRDVKTEHCIVLSCIKQQFKAITFNRAVQYHIFLCGMEGHVGKEGYFYCRFCIIHVQCENPYIAVSALSFQDCVQVMPPNLFFHWAQKCQTSHA